MNGAATHFTETFRVADMGPMVSGKSFVNCLFEGPAIMLPINSEMTDSHLEGVGGAEGIFWEVAPDRTDFVGVIAFDSCKFNGCTFRGVGIAGTREFIDKFMEG